MKTNRIIVVLLSLTLLMQGVLLYKQYHGNTAARSKPENVRDAPKGTTMEVAGLPTEGDDTAKVVLIEFSDYECPFCARHATGVGRKLNEEFVASGKARHVFSNLPLPIHKNAKLFAIAAICAGEQEHYWQMHDMLFDEKPKGKDELLPIVQKLGLDSTRFEQCLDHGASAQERINLDLKQADQFKLTGTPSFAIGRVDSSGKVVIQKFIIGALPIETFEKTINDVLSFIF